MTTATPPPDEAERHVLGSLMLRREAIDETATILEPADFYAVRHETIYSAVLALHHRGHAAVTLTDELTKTGEITRVGEVAYLHDMITLVPTATNVGYYARIVAEQAIRRRLHTTGTRLVQLSASGEGDIDELVETCRTEIDALSRATATTGWVATDIDTTIDDLEKPTPSIPTPWPGLNHLIGGWAPGRLYLIGARPAIGKSLNAAAALATTGPAASTPWRCPARRSTTGSSHPSPGSP